MRKILVTAWALLLIASIPVGVSADASDHVAAPAPVMPAAPTTDLDVELESVVAELGGLSDTAASIWVQTPCCAGASCLVSSCGNTCCTENQTPYCRCSITGTAECGCTAGST